MSFFLPLIRAACASIFIACSGGAATAASSAILPVPDGVQAPLPLYDPSAYGPSTIARQHARQIIAAWRVEAVTMPWTTLMLEMIVKHKVAPARAARGSALLHVAMYDAWSAGGSDTVRKIAVSAAAAQVLGYWFTAEEHGFDRIVGQLLPALAATADQRAAGLATGFWIGRQAVNRGEADGAARGWNGVRLQWYGEGRSYGPNTWTPTAPYFYYPPEEPFASGWKAWVVADPSQLRPVPPSFGSARFIKDLREVVALQKNLTPEQLRIAKFWVDGSGSVTPPGHWNKIAQELVRKYQLGSRETAGLFASLNIALADSFITAWYTKYYYWTARPVTMAKIVLGIDFTPVILTPPFPSYVSGHAAFSGAAARILGTQFPDERGPLDTMAEEAAMSRLYGGIHYRFDNEGGLAMGRAVADLVLQQFAGTIVVSGTR